MSSQKWALALSISSLLRAVELTENTEALLLVDKQLLRIQTIVNLED